MTKSLFSLAVTLLVFSPATALHAQILNGPVSQPLPTQTQSTQGSLTAQPGAFSQMAQQPMAPPQTVVQQAGGAIVPLGEVKQTGWPGIPMPKLTLPKLELPSMAAVTKPLKLGANKIKAGTKKAWEGTKDIFSITKRKVTPRAQRAQQPKKSFWKRLLVRETEPQVPQTVGEFMSQPKLLP